MTPEHPIVFPGLDIAEVDDAVRSEDKQKLNLFLFRVYDRCPCERSELPLHLQREREIAIKLCLRGGLSRHSYLFGMHLLNSLS